MSVSQSLAGVSTISPPRPTAFSTWLKHLKSHLGYRANCLQRRFSYQIAQSPDSDASVALVGQAAYARPLIDDYLKHPAPVPVRRMRRWPTAQLGHRLARDHGLVFFDSESAPRAVRSQLLHIPQLVGMAREITGSIVQTRASLSLQTRTQLKNIEASGLRFEISRDPALLPEFHARYYAPSMTQRHDTLASICPVDVFQKIIRDGGELLRAFDGDRWVAGMIASVSRDGYHLEKCGWRDGDAPIVNAGAIKFLYWQGIVRATELGLPRVYFGGTPNDLSNGILFQKSRWGARIIQTGDRYPNWSVLLNPEHPSVRDYLNRHTLIISDTDKGFIVLSTRLPSETPAYSSQGPAISAWYRLRETPAAVITTLHAHLPALLVPWFDSIPL